MKLSKSLLSCCIIFSVLFLSACTEKDNASKLSCSTSQEDVLLAYANQFSEDLDHCYSSLVNLELADWNTITDADKELVAESRMAYNAVSSYNFGPAIVNGIELNDRFNIFPANEAAINTNALAGEQDIESLFKSHVGLEAIEYLVYNIDSIASTGNERAAIVQHLEAQISAVKARMESLKSAYTNGYIPEFKSNTGSDDGSSLALFTNQFVQDLETRLRNNKLRIPIGKFNGGVPLTDKVEGRYSDRGLEYAAQHFTKLKNLFGAASDSLSLSAYLVCLGEVDLSKSIEDQFAIASSAYVELEVQHGVSLVDAINTNSEGVSALIDEHQKLVALLKGPMLSALGVRINYTDSDGD